MRSIRRVGLALVRGALAMGALLGGSHAEAGDIVVFVGRNDPRENWSYGYGAALTSTLFKVIALEAEAARFPGVSADVASRAPTMTDNPNMTAFTGSALLAPSLGKLTPYGGAGVGFFRQSLGSRSDTGILRARVFGLKLKISDLLVVKAEYRGISLSGEPLIELDRRLSVGAGIAF